jgi:hypothetical protein
MKSGEVFIWAAAGKTSNARMANHNIAFFMLPPFTSV